MCSMCSDYVASCWVCTQPMRGNPDKTIGKQFYLELGTTGTFCKHFRERYKTASPSMYSHISTEHSQENEDGEEYWIYECEDDCVTNEWYTPKQVREVVDAFNEWGEQY